MKIINKFVRRFSADARAKRANIFRSHFQIDGNTRILDLGSEDGSNIFSVLQNTNFDAGNVFIADIEAELVNVGNKRYGFTPVVANESGILPFSDNYFDIVYCSSVIEHVTVAKSDLWEWKDGAKFKASSWERQREFANEIIRLGKRYFVQTPDKYFPIESHTWLPLIGYLPRSVFLPILSVTNQLWVKAADPDFSLLSQSEMKTLFPDAEILLEKTIGLTKSIMAIKK